MKSEAFLPLASAAAPPNPEKIRTASRGFEGLFLAQLFKVMKQSVLSGKQEGLFKSDALGEFAELEFARVLAERRSIGLADLLGRSLVKAGEAAAPDVAGPEGLPLDGVRKAAVPLRRAAVPLAVAKPPLAGPIEAPLSVARPPLQRAQAPLASAPKPSIYPDLDPIISRAAQRHKVHPDLLRAVIACESGGDSRAISPKGAKGLMQLVDSTAQMLGVRNVWNPAENVEGGARYLRSLLDRFDGRLDWALAAYNAGPTAVERHGGIPPYPETQVYVKRVLDRYARLGADSDGS